VTLHWLQVILFAAHHVLTPDVSPDGYILLKLIQSYLKLDMFTSLTVQTELTIAAGEAEILRFEEVLRVRFNFHISSLLTEI